MCRPYNSFVLLVLSEGSRASWVNSNHCCWENSSKCMLI